MTTQVKLRLGGCQRCRGDQSLSYDDIGSKKIEVWTCIQCARAVEGEVVRELTEKLSPSELQQLMTT